MVKINQFIAPSNGAVWCISVEYVNAENKPVYKAYYDAFTIELIQSEQWREQLKENTGQNIALITVSEEPN
jgi:hypothetical protein